MTNINRATLVGRLVADPRAKNLPNGQALTTFRVATNRYIKSGEGYRSLADFHNVTIWGKMAEKAGSRLKKGQPVYVEGRLNTSNWEDDQKVRRYKTEIVAQRVVFLDEKNNQEVTQQESEDVVVEDMPFEG